MGIFSKNSAACPARSKAGGITSATYHDDMNPDRPSFHSEKAIFAHSEHSDTSSDLDPEIQYTHIRWKRAASPWLAPWSKISGLLLALFLLASLAFLLGRSTAGSDKTEGLPQSHAAGKRKALVISGIKSTNTTWLREVSEEWEIYHYVADDAYTDLLPVPRNQGYEAMAYLTFILDNYNNLPDYTVFIHGHERAWHQPQPMPYLLRALNLDVVDEKGWMPLRCDNWGRCSTEEYLINPNTGTWTAHLLLRGLHQFAYRPEDPWYEPLPDILAAACCAQFAVSKKQVQSKPREFWNRLRTPLLRDFEKNFLEWNPEETNFSGFVGAAFEVAWHWFFGMPPVTCHQEEYCRNTLFQSKIHCEGNWTANVDAYKNVTCTFDE